MFRRGKLWRSERISSDEGFSVILGERDASSYFEGSRKMTIAVNEGNKSIPTPLHAGMIIPCTDRASKDRARIADNIKRAFESQGLPVHFLS